MRAETALANQSGLRAFLWQGRIVQAVKIFKYIIDGCSATGHFIRADPLLCLVQHLFYKPHEMGF